MCEHRRTEEVREQHKSPEVQKNAIDPIRKPKALNKDDFKVSKSQVDPGMSNPLLEALPPLSIFCGEEFYRRSS